jgi:hypothetical protein
MMHGYSSLQNESNKQAAFVISCKDTAKAREFLVKFNDNQGKRETK